MIESLSTNDNRFSPAGKRSDYGERSFAAKDNSKAASGVGAP
jgi:hypothetical protein